MTTYPPPPQGGYVNWCNSCGKDFNSMSAFDLHRVGQHGINRRCLTTEEMQAIGMVKNKYGRWCIKAMSKDRAFYVERDAENAHDDVE